MADKDHFESEFSGFGPITSDDDKPRGFIYYFTLLFRRKVTESKNQDIADSGGMIAKQNVESQKELKRGEQQDQLELLLAEEIRALSSDRASLFPDQNLTNIYEKIEELIENQDQPKDALMKQHWLPDASSHECCECKEKFTTFRRRHHCRICGQIFCSKCCREIVPGKIFGYTGDVRSCGYCCKVLFLHLRHGRFSAQLANEMIIFKERLLANGAAECAVSLDLGSRVSSLRRDSTQQATKTHFKKPSYGFIEEKYAVNVKFEEPSLDSKQIDRISTERQLLLKDSQELRALCSLIIEGPDKLPLNTHRHRLKSFPNSFAGRDLIQWLLAQDRASSKQSAVAIGQALLDAGFIVCVSQMQQTFMDDYVLYQPVKTKMISGRSSCPSTTCRKPHDSGEEPLWVKELPTMAESEEKESGDSKLEEMPVENISALTSSSSSYYLDLNIKDNVVSVTKPKNVRKVTPHPGAASPDVERDDAQGGSSVSNALSASAAVPFLGAEHAPADGGPVSKEVLEAVRGFNPNNGGWGGGGVVSHSRASGWLQRDFEPETSASEGDEDHSTKLNLRMQKRLHTLWTKHESTLMSQLLRYSGLSQTWQDVLLPVIYTVSSVVRPDVKNETDLMDIREYVHFKKVSGQSRRQCDIVNGVVCTKNVLHSAMITKRTNPQILLVASHIDYQRGDESKLVRMEDVLMQEANFMKDVVGKIVSHKPDVILAEKGIAFLATETFKRDGISVAANVKPSVLERVSRCTQAQVITSVESELKPQTLGMCHSFYLRSHNASESTPKSLMFFDGCATHLGCTVILRGPSMPELRKLKRITYFMIFALYNWKLERSFLMDEFSCFEGFIVSPSKERKAVEASDVRRRLDLDGGGEEEEEGKSDPLSPAQQAAEEASKVGRNDGGHSIAEKFPTKEVVFDLSDPLQSILEKGVASPRSETEMLLNLGPKESNFEDVFVKAFNSTVLSVSPLIHSKPPFLLSDEGVRSTLKKFIRTRRYYSNLFREEESSLFVKKSPSPKKTSKPLLKKEVRKVQHYFQTRKWTKSAKDLEFQSALADFRARGGTMRVVCECEGKQDVYGVDSQFAGAEEKRIPVSPMKSNKNDRQNVDGAAMLTDDNKMDALHPFNHQKLSVVFSVFSQAFRVTSAFCVNPRVITMEFYGLNDIPLGAFLENYCFSTSYSCPSEFCNVDCVSHVRKFAHQNGCVEVLLRKFNHSLRPDESSNICMWNWCRICSQVSPVIAMSSETWSFSFAKYLELRFHESSLVGRGSHPPSGGCRHSIHQDHFHYFVKKNILAAFKYVPISTRELIIPSSQIKYAIKPVPQNTVVDTIKSVALQGYSVFSLIHEHLLTLSAETTSRWESLIKAMASNHNQQRQAFREGIETIQLELTSPSMDVHWEDRVDCPSEPALPILMFRIADHIVMLQRHILRVVTEWNAKVQEFLQLKKKEEKMKLSLGKVSQSTASALPTGNNDEPSVVPAAATTQVEDEISQASASQPPKDELQKEDTGDSDLGESMLTEGAAHDASEGADDNDTTKSDLACELEPLSRVHDELGKFLRRLNKLRAYSPSLRFSLSPRSPSSGSVSSSSEDYFSNYGSERDVSGGVQAVIPPDSKYSPLKKLGAECVESMGLFGVHTIITGSPAKGIHERSFSDGGGPVDYAREAMERNIIPLKETVEKSTPEKRYGAVKNILTNLWSSSVDLMVKSPFESSEHYLLLPEVRIPIAVYDEEPSSIIAHALASREYDKQVFVLQKNLKESLHARCGDPCQGSCSGAADESHPPFAHDEFSVLKEPHIELQWSDVNTNFYCKIYFAERFRRLRASVFPAGEEAFLRSLSRCVIWDAKGGKSGSFFCKTTDDRFVLKEMSKFEINSFLDFGPSYVKYILDAHKDNQPTTLTKIVGAYRIGFKNSLTNKAQKTDLLVMENLFYQRTISHKFDLKGSLRNRLVNPAQKSESDVVWLDENLLKMACSTTLYLREHSKEVLIKAISNDSTFLSRQFIMDYSLLLGEDVENNVMVVGIIDYIRTFTWDKKLETILKGSVLSAGTGKLPTVVSPELYRTRFCEAMKQYFISMPDKWHQFEPESVFNYTS